MNIIIKTLKEKLIKLQKEFYSLEKKIYTNSFSEIITIRTTFQEMIKEYRERL